MGVIIPQYRNREEPNVVLQSYINFLQMIDDAEVERRNEYRDYYDGVHEQQLTADMLEQLGREDDSSYNPIVNICPIIVDVENNRLRVQGFTVSHDNESTSGDLEKYLQQVWRLSSMKAKSTAFHKSGIKVGDSFLFVAIEDERVRINVHHYYDGNSGMIPVYTDDNDPESLLYIIHIWTVHQPLTRNSNRVQRMNILWENRVEYFITDVETGKWVPYLRDGAELFELPDPFSENENDVYVASVAWMTKDGTPSGESMGIPVFHYAHNSDGGVLGVSGLKDALPIQDSVNLANADLIAAAQLAGFPINYASGFNPKNDEYTSSPGGFVYKRSTEGEFGQLPAARLDQLIAVKEGHIKEAAMVTGTPLNFFNLTGQLPAEGTQQALQETLTAKVELAQTRIGLVYERALRYALLLTVVYLNEPEVTVSVDEIVEMEIKTNWQEARPRSQLERIEVAKGLQELGIPRDVIWADPLDYSPEEIEDMTEKAKVIRSAVLGEVLDRFDQQQQAPVDQPVVGQQQPNNLEGDTEDGTQPPTDIVDQ